MPKGSKDRMHSQMIRMHRPELTFWKKVPCGYIREILVGTSFIERDHIDQLIKVVRDKYPGIEMTLYKGR